MKKTIALLLVLTMVSLFSVACKPVETTQSETAVAEKTSLSTESVAQADAASSKAIQTWLETYGALQVQALEHFNADVPTEYKNRFSEVSMTIFSVDILMTQASISLSDSYTTELGKESFESVGAELLSVEQKGQSVTTTFKDKDGKENTYTFQFDEATSTADLTLEANGVKLIHMSIMAKEGQVAKTFQGAEGGKSAEFFYDSHTVSGVIGIGSHEIEPLWLYKNPEAAQDKNFGEKFTQVAILKRGVLELKR